MRINVDVLLDYELPEPHDVLLQIEVAQMTDQRLLADHLSVLTSEQLCPMSGHESVGQRTWVAAAGRFKATYQASVEIDRAVIPLDRLDASDPRTLPPLVVPYLLPSRYCASDKFEPFAAQQFGALSGGQKIAAMQQWITTHLSYVSGASTIDTTASDTFVQRQGVCRDYAHLLVTLARAAMVPARVVSAYAPNVDPPDFHAVAEVWLDGGWHLIDATGMARPEEIVRIAVGRDATDIAFMTVFGTAVFKDQRVTVTRA